MAALEHVIALLGKRNWSVTTFNDGRSLADFLLTLKKEPERKPDIVLLDTAINSGGRGELDIFWRDLVVELKVAGISQGIVPFSEQKEVNRSMLAHQQELEIRMLDFLGEGPIDRIFLEAGLGNPSLSH